MKIQVCGMSHKTAPVEVREKISFPSSKLNEALAALGRHGEIKERVILSTCNRVEIYAVTPSGTSPEELAAFLREFHNIKERDIAEHIYYYDNLDAAKHLLRVVTSLDSMVIGETQILGQVKRAFAAAQDGKHTGPVFNALFEEAIKTGKLARSETQIGKGSVSIGSVSVELATKVLSDLSAKTMLIIGAGKAAELTVQNLIERGVSKVLVANRTYEKAKELADKFGGEAVDFTDICRQMARSDIVIGSAAAPHIVISKESVRQAMNERGQKQLFLIDIAVPRIIDRAVSGIDNVHLYDIDDLDKVRDGNLQERMSEVKKVEQIIAGRMKRIKEKLALGDELVVANEVSCGL